MKKNQQIGKKKGKKSTKSEGEEFDENSEDKDPQNVATGEETESKEKIDEEHLDVNEHVTVLENPSSDQ